MTRAFLSLGSNLGDRLGYMRKATEALARGPLLEVRDVSMVYETGPVEVEEAQPDYLNCVVEVDCGVPALEMLRFCQGVEAALGRERKGERAPRTLDVDVLLFGGEVRGEGPLILPHPGIGRAFNLKGLADLDAGLYIPGRGTVGELLAGEDLADVREYEGGL
jgi:2-amino-4-hydroxy-6-hydroxymethyldihydropteridine diphosphokinase